MQAAAWRNLMPRPRDCVAQPLHPFSSVLKENSFYLDRKLAKGPEREEEENICAGESLMNLTVPLRFDVLLLLVDMYKQLREQKLSTLFGFSKIEEDILQNSLSCLERIVETDETKSHLSRVLQLWKSNELKTIDLDNLLTLLIENREKFHVYFDSLTRQCTEHEEQEEEDSSSISFENTAFFGLDADLVDEQEDEEESRVQVDEDVVRALKIYQAVKIHEKGGYRKYQRHDDWNLPHIRKRVAALTEDDIAQFSLENTSHENQFSNQEQQRSIQSLPMQANKKMRISALNGVPSNITGSSEAFVASSSSKRLIEFLASQTRISVSRTASRYPTNASELVCRYFIESAVAKLLRQQMTNEYQLLALERFSSTHGKVKTERSIILPDLSNTNSIFASLVVKRAKAILHVLLAEKRLFSSYLSLDFEPTILQMLVCCRLKAQRHFGMWTASGSGRSTTALIAAQYVGAKKALFLSDGDCFNPRSCITIKKHCERLLKNERQCFSFESYRNLRTFDEVNAFLSHFDEDVDFVVFDNADRAGSLEMLLYLRKQLKKDVYVLVTSATVIGEDANVETALSLLELVSGEKLASQTAIASKKDEKSNDIVDESMIHVYLQLYGFYFEMPISIQETVVQSQIDRTNCGDQQQQFIIEKIRGSKEYDRADVVSLLSPWKKNAIAQALSECSMPLAEQKREDDHGFHETPEKLIIYVTLFSKHDTETISDKIIAAIKELCPIARVGVLYEGGSASNSNLLNRFMLPHSDENALDVLVGSSNSFYECADIQLQTVCSRIVFYTVPETVATYRKLCGLLARWGQPKIEITVYYPRCTTVDHGTMISFEDASVRRLSAQTLMFRRILFGSERKQLQQQEKKQQQPNQSLTSIGNGSSGTNAFSDEENVTNQARYLFLAVMRAIFDKKDAKEQEEQQKEAVQNDLIVQTRAMYDEMLKKWNETNGQTLMQQIHDNPDHTWRRFHLLRDTLSQNGALWESHPCHTIAYHIWQRENSLKRRGKTVNDIRMADIGCGREPTLAIALSHFFHDAINVLSVDLFVETTRRDCITQGEAQSLSQDILPDNSFEYIVCCESLMGTKQNVFATLKRLRRALTEHGRLILMQKSAFFETRDRLYDFSQTICGIGMSEAEIPLYSGKEEKEYVMLCFTKLGDLRVPESSISMRANK